MPGKIQDLLIFIIYQCAISKWFWKSDCPNYNELSTWEDLKQIRLLAFSKLDWNKQGLKTCCLIRQDNTIYKFSIKLSFSSIEQDKSKLQKQIFESNSSLTEKFIYVQYWKNNRQKTHC